jgi:hypothetical protein
VYAGQLPGTIAVVAALQLYKPAYQSRTTLKAQSLSLSGLTMTLPCWSVMGTASPEMSDRGLLVV